jgi:hypothetical protein
MGNGRHGMGDVECEGGSITQTLRGIEPGGIYIPFLELELERVH